MNMILAVLDIIGAVMMVSLMKEITADFGLRTRAERWAFFRRIFYAAVAIALFAKGVYRFEHLDRVVDMKDEGSQLVIVAYIIIFPLLRAVGCISQDRWI